MNKVVYLSNKDDPAVKNSILDAVKNRVDLQKWILAISDFGQELQQDINEITGGDEKFNNAVIRHVLDLKSDSVFRNPQPISLLFNDVQKFHQQNSIIGKLATQIKKSKLTDEEITKRQFLKGEIAKIEDRLYNLKNRNTNDKYDDDDDDNDDDDAPKYPSKGGSSAPPMQEAEMDPSFRQPPEPKRDLQKVFEKLRFGKVKPREALPDPFSPTFWNEVFDDPTETLKQKTD